MYDFYYNDIRKNTLIVSYFLLILIHVFTISRQKEIFMKTFEKTGLYLTIVITQNLLSIFLKKTKK